MVQLRRTIAIGQSSDYYDELMVLISFGLCLVDFAWFIVVNFQKISAPLTMWATFDLDACPYIDHIQRLLGPLNLFLALTLRRYSLSCENDRVWVISLGRIPNRSHNSMTTDEVSQSTKEFSRTHRYLT
jgi:hypothetical protein